VPNSANFRWLCSFSENTTICDICENIQKQPNYAKKSHCRIILQALSICHGTGSGENKQMFKASNSVKNTYHRRESTLVASTYSAHRHASPPITRAFWADVPGHMSIQRMQTNSHKYSSYLDWCISPHADRPASSVTRGTRLSSQFVTPGFTAVQCIIDFSLFGLGD